ncbi:ATP-binding cassette domain-containing protein [Streptomyces sp. NPDC056672]|uniref:ABC transporter ATP-binding protein n=1 Tax=Streptomyces sp. NPDC056672 TaxID=3345906 RepID=UPI00369E3373
MRDSHAPERRHGDSCIDVEDLVVTYRVRVRENAMAMRRARRRKSTVEAVRGVSFSVGRGEIVGFLGPNGAGKTSVLKCLSGLLHPTAGRVKVLGHTPHRRSTDFLRDITLSMGQRNQLLWDLPPVDTFLANKAIYRIPDARYRRTLDDLIELLGLGPLLSKPVRQLSLGERTRCELAAALLHEPRVLFLDEPTLGLDVEGQQALRTFVAQYRRKRHATVLLTSHDMSDIVDVSDRVLLIDGGRVRYDGDLAKLVAKVAPDVLIRCRTPHTVPPPLPGCSAVWWEGEVLCVRAPRELAAHAASTLLSSLKVSDLTVTPPAVEDVLREMIVGEIHGKGSASTLLAGDTNA